MSNGIIFSIASGAIPPGAIFYQVNCGPPTPVGNMLCLTGVGPHYITFCKPGNNTNQYQITALAQPQSGPDATATIGCSQSLYVDGLDAPSTTWTSIYPGASGAYNSYLSCTSGCDSVTVTPGPGAPAYVDYLVCGYVFGGCFPFTYCDTLRVNINQDLSSVNTNINCFGQSTGAIDLTVPGTSPATYLWSNGSTSQDISGLVAGSYSVNVTDASGCTRTLSATITQPPAINIAGSATPVTCYGAANGSINITPSGGTGGYSFSWSNGATTEDISGLTAGNYTVTVTDANGCTATYSAAVTQPLAPLTISGIQSNVLCFGNATGSVDITSAGGTPGYTYSWSTGAVTEDITGLSAGSYTVTLTDANGCTTSYSALINQPAAPLSVISVTTDVLCFGGATGSVNITPSGGTPGYTYAWSNGGVTEDITGLVAGSYSVTITDANACTLSYSAVISQPAAPLSVSGTSTNVLCFGGSTGSIDLTPSGGTPGYTYTWSNGAVTQDITGLGPGSYNVTVTDANGCTNASYSATITQPSSALTVNGSSTNVLCYGGTSGSVNITATGGTPTYTYLWSNGSVTEDLSGVGAGSYTVTVTDANGCTNNSFTSSVMQPLALMVSGDAFDPSCAGYANGNISITPSGGTVPYSFSWNTGSSGKDIYNLVQGGYTVVVTDANGCTVSGNWSLLDPPPLNISSVVDPILCFGSNSGNILLNIAGGTVPYNVLWNTGNTNTTLSNLGPGNYSVTVTDSRGCTVSDTYVLTTPPPLSVSMDSLYTIWLGESVTLEAMANGGTGTYTFSWNPQDDLSCSDCSVTLASPENNIGYLVTVTDQNGCTASAGAYIEVLFVMYVPNSFTPNGDNDNDVFLAVSESIKDFTMRIFDRWGEEIFTSSNINEGWNGIFKQVEAKQDVYVYRIEATFLNGVYKEVIGQVNLIR